MKLIFSTAALVIEGRTFEGFPLLLDSEGWPLEPVQTFLWNQLVLSGSVQSKLTWEAYGRRLYDYFNFLESNDLRWNDENRPIGLSVLAKYREWSTVELGLTPSTVNKRLSLIVKFYHWCKRKGHIQNLPFSMRDVRIKKQNGLLAHVSSSSNIISKPTVMVREHRASMQFLNKDQIKVCFGTEIDPSYSLLFHLMLRTGMRSCEARSFPVSYVFNPRTKSGLSSGQMIRIRLEPSDMKIKYDKPRSIDVPWSLMEDMWNYSLHQRELRRRRSGESPASLVLTKQGTEFSKGAVVDAMKAIESKVGFPVRAHMLRHSYCTYTLSALRKSSKFEGEPLLYVRDRAGHTDVQTTAIYLHLINQLDAQIILAHEDEMDLLFSYGQSLPLDRYNT
ncbi:MAG: tyrosine-type recombinase/integrase [Candidatus Paceibacterota bacterium]